MRRWLTVGGGAIGRVIVDDQDGNMRRTSIAPVIDALSVSLVEP